MVATGSKGIVGTSSAPTLEVKEKAEALMSSNPGQDVTDRDSGSNENSKVVKIHHKFSLKM